MGAIFKWECNYQRLASTDSSAYKSENSMYYGGSIKRKHVVVAIVYAPMYIIW
ncbi:MAG: hypothetical protein QW292_03850 [Candidatus Parvarchaeota archaeon]